MFGPKTGLVEGQKIVRDQFEKRKARAGPMILLAVRRFGNYPAISTSSNPISGQIPPVKPGGSREFRIGSSLDAERNFKLTQDSLNGKRLTDNNPGRTAWRGEFAKFTIF